jgi:hypothetical protein
MCEECFLILSLNSAPGLKVAFFRVVIHAAGSPINLQYDKVKVLSSGGICMSAYSLTKHTQNPILQTRNLYPQRKVIFNLFLFLISNFFCCVAGAIVIKPCRLWCLPKSDPALVQDGHYLGDILGWSTCGGVVPFYS